MNMFACFELLFCIFMLYCTTFEPAYSCMGFDNQKKKSQEPCDLVAFYSSFNVKNMTSNPFPILNVRRGKIKES